MEKFIVAQFFIKPEYLDTFKASIADVVKNTREEEGNIFYNAYQSIEKPTDFIFYEEFKDQQGFDFHLNTEHYKRFASIFNELQSKEPIVKIIT